MENISLANNLNVDTVYLYTIAGRRRHSWPVLSYHPSDLMEKVAVQRGIAQHDLIRLSEYIVGSGTGATSAFTLYHLRTTVIEAIIANQQVAKAA